MEKDWAFEIDIMKDPFIQLTKKGFLVEKLLSKKNTLLLKDSCMLSQVWSLINISEHEQHEQEAAPSIIM